MRHDNPLCGTCLCLSHSSSVLVLPHVLCSLMDASLRFLESVRFHVPRLLHSHCLLCLKGPPCCHRQLLCASLLLAVGSFNLDKLSSATLLPPWRTW